MYINMEFMPAKVHITVWLYIHSSNFCILRFCTGWCELSKDSKFKHCFFFNIYRLKIWEKMYQLQKHASTENWHRSSTVPETFYFSTWIVNESTHSEWWAQSKRTVSVWWAPIEPNFVIASEWWVNTGQTEHKREHKVNDERYVHLFECTVSTLWTHRKNGKS